MVKLLLSMRHPIQAPAEFWLLHLSSSFLVVLQGKQWKAAKVFGPRSPTLGIQMMLPPGFFIWTDSELANGVSGE